MKNIIIFGNGLGRALSNEFFSLTRALQEAWNDDDVLTNAQRDLIRRCLPEDVVEEEGAPTKEEHLDKLQQILAACDLVNELENDTDQGWLTGNGKEFPSAIRSYVHRAACEFHFGDHVIPEEFAEPLRAHVVERRTHVATLNYDELLYSNFVGTDVFRGYSCLIDGFANGRFSEANLERFFPSQTSYYLHLHGSPLFHDDELNTPQKAGTASVGLLAGNRSGHIVLTNVKHKQSVIASSPLLSAYWEKLKTALDESNRITLFGYSGFDTHLNRRINERLKTGSECTVRIVERKADGPAVRRRDYWKKIFNGCELVRCDNILSFTDW